MNHYGLTEEEKRTHLQEYNHALFKNSLSFMDIVWEINLLYDTIVILEDKTDIDRNLAELPYEDFIHAYEEMRILENDLSVFHEYMDLEKLKCMKDETAFYIHLRASDKEWHLHRVVLTPAIDENGTLYCVYLGALNLHDEEQREISIYRYQSQFREALMSGCYFHYNFDVTTGGMIKEDFTARDGSHPIKNATGMNPPVSFDFWIQKWYELYEPQFDLQEEENIFTVDYFKRAFAKNERLLSIEAKQKAQDGSGRTEFMHIFVLLLENPEDKHIHACIIWRDITPFRRGIIESKLDLQTKNEELTRTIDQEKQFRQATLSGAIMVYNINLTRNLIEDEFYEIVDGNIYPMLQLVGLTAPCNFDTFCERWSESKVSEDSRETFRQMYNRQYLLDSYAKGENHLEIEFDTTIGRGIPVTLRNTALLVEDSRTGDIIAMINGKDVTDQRKEEHKKQEALRTAYEAANRANNAKSDFLSRMSHDIRTPMNAIIGMTAIATTHLDDKERVLDCLQKITVSSKHLLGLINEVLDMSKIESGKINLQNETFILPDLVETLLEIAKPQIKAKQHDLSVSLRGIEHENVIGDSQRIQEAFMNLFSNAIKYTPQGGKIRLTITEKPTNRPLIGCFEFIVEDNGIGMGEEFKKKLFMPFERAEDERARKEQGTGLGMPIAKSIVQMMNGKIEVESEFNKGTKCTMTIFLKLQEPEQDVSYEDIVKLPVLVADDDEIACESTCGMLSELGIEGEWVLSGAEAVERVVARHEKEDDYYAVIVDWQMPGMDGIETTKEIRRLVGMDIPIIILSAYDWSDIEQEARAAGANAFISKPLFKSRLTYLFNNLTGRNTPARQKSALEKLETENFHGSQALLVEDNDINAEIAEEIFKMIGLSVERVENGKEALDRMTQVEDGYYDIVFMDIQMPVMNGYEAARAIRALDRTYTKSVPIIAMTANAFAEDVQEARAAGMNEHVAKPLDFDRLRNVLKKWIPQGQAE